FFLRAAFRRFFFLSIGYFYMRTRFKKIFEPIECNSNPHTPVVSSLELFHVNKSNQSTPEMGDVSARIRPNRSKKGKENSDASNVFYFYRPKQHQEKSVVR